MEAVAKSEMTRTVEMQRVEGFRFRIDFGGEVPPVVADEPAPLGAGSGPDAARMLAAAVGNCLSASLLLCLQKSRVEVTDLRATVTLTLARNERGRFRVTRGSARLVLATGGAAPEKTERCLGMFEDYCIVTATIRQAFPVDVEVVDPGGRSLYHSEGA